MQLCHVGVAARRVGAAALLFMFSQSLLPDRAAAICNAIPGAVGIHRGSVGTLNRPFASPGDLIGINVNKALCDHGLSAGFSVAGPDHVVTFVFEPQTGDRNAAIVASNCADLAAERAQCQADLGGGQVACFEAGPADLVIDDKQDPVLRLPTRRLFVRLPDTGNVPDQTAFGGPAVFDYGLAPGHTLSGPATVVVRLAGEPLACELASTRCLAPNADGFRACVDEFYELDGTCDRSADKVDGTFGHFTALPPPNDYAAVCSTADTECTAAEPDLLFTTDAAGNALVPWDYSGVTKEQGGLPVARIGTGSLDGFPAFSGAPAGIRVPTKGFLTSHAPEGFPLPPVFTPLPEASGEVTLFGTIDAPRGVMRVARTSPVAKQCSAGEFIGKPCVDPVDCAGESCTATLCAGGDNPDTPCAGDFDCPNGACPLPPLFEFRDRYGDAGIGPVAISGSEYAVEADVSVALSGVQETGRIFTLVINEAVEGRDLNGDGDQDDFTFALADAATGRIENVGNPSLARVDVGTAKLPVISAEGTVAAIMVSEARDQTDYNLDGDLDDSSLQAFELGSGVSLTAGLKLSGGSSSPLGRPAVFVADGIASWGSVETLGAHYSNLRVSSTPGGTAPNLAAVDGHAGSFLGARNRFVAYTSGASDILNVAPNPAGHIYVVDRDTDVNGVYDELGFTSTTLVSVNSAGEQAEIGSVSRWPWITPNGRFVAFGSTASNLVAGDTNGQVDIFVRDRDVDDDQVLDEPFPDSKTVRVSVSSAGAQGIATPLSDFCIDSALDGLGGVDPATGQSLMHVQLTPDGRYVLFHSAFSNLVPGDTNHVCDVFVHDRDTNVDQNYDEPGFILTERVSVDENGVEGTAASLTSIRDIQPLSGALALAILRNPRMSDDGQAIAFESLGQLDVAFLSADAVNCSDVFVRYRSGPLAGQTELASSSFADGLPCSNIGILGLPFGITAVVDAMSPDGRKVALMDFGFTSMDDPGSAFSPADPAFADVFLFEVSEDGGVSTGRRKANLTPAGGQPNGDSGSAQFVDGGRVLSFGSFASNLVEDDVDGVGNTFSLDLEGGQIAKNGAGGFVFPSLFTWANSEGGQVFSSIDALPDDPADLNGLVDVSVGEFRPELPANIDQDLNLDGDLQDTYIEMVDLTGTPGETFRLRAHLRAFNKGGALAYLEPERNYGTPDPAVGAPMNGDADIADFIVRLYPGRVSPGGSIVNASLTPELLSNGLPLSGREVSLSDAVLAVLVRETDEGADLDGEDGIRDTLVAHICDRSATPPTCQNTGKAALDASRPGDFTRLSPQAPGSEPIGPPIPIGIAALEPQPAWSAPFAAVWVNGTFEPVSPTTFVPLVQLHLGTLETPPRVFPDDFGAVPVPASEFTVGDDFIVFRSPEAPGPGLGGGDLNGDGDTEDVVLQAFDLVTGQVVNSQSTAVLCEFEVCDPTRPYRVEGRTVRFLTDEAKEGRDLNGDLDQVDLVVQLFNLDADPSQGGRRVEFVAEVEDAPGGAASDQGLGIDPLAPPPFDGPDDTSQFLIASGVCSESGRTCNSNLDCVGGVEICQEDVLAAVGAQDRDLDKILDAVDNCPDTPNPDQKDEDFDSVGDLCDLETCGNGIQEGSEACDDGKFCSDKTTACNGPADCTGIGDELCRPRNGDSCSRLCRVAGCFGDVNLDGDVDSQDAVSLAVAPGCYPCIGAECDPACDGNNDGVVNNADLLLFDSVLGTSCLPAVAGSGSTPSGSLCGLGMEIALLLPPLAAWRRRRLSRARVRAA